MSSFPVVSDLPRRLADPHPRLRVGDAKRNRNGMKIRRASLLVPAALALLATPLPTAAQQTRKIPRAGFLSWAGPGGPTLADEFLQGLRDSSW